ncbi:MAG: adenine deaminase [Dehalococcoidia bacterium]|nr:MAG: adenine deaminase [Dehalococcoidia bacterium]
MFLVNLIAVARGDRPADLLLKNASIINTFTGEIEKGNVAISGQHIAGIGPYTEAKETIDLKGSYLSPGFINGHIHIESSMLHPGQYARSVVPHGTTSIVTDLHEIANVAGIDGIKFVLKCASTLPLDVFFKAPSCVPATHMETAGASIDADAITRLLKMKENDGLGEMMNYPGVINTFAPVLDKLRAARRQVIDGHAPGLSGQHLNAYMAAGIYSDHEVTTLEEGREKLRKGMYIMIREGSSEKNLATLLPLAHGDSWKRCMLVVDDRSCSDLLSDGDVDAVIRKAIKLGLNPIRAIQLATINAAEHHRLFDLGAIGPGYRANLVTITDLQTLKIDKVFHNGKLSASGGKYLGTISKKSPKKLLESVHIKKPDKALLEIEGTGAEFPVIEIIPGQIVTKKTMVKLPKGIFKADLNKDIIKAAVFERHKSTGNIGVGLVKGFGIKNGAIASTIAHDSHNLVVAGASDKDILAAVKAIEEMQGGLVVCKDGKTIAKLPLPVCGLLSLNPAEEVSRQFNELEKIASTLGNLPPAPFSLLSFIALPVIPELRITDMGIVDVLQFKLI